jgi:hypothetical protein
VYCFILQHFSLFLLNDLVHIFSLEISIIFWRNNSNADWFVPLGSMENRLNSSIFCNQKDLDDILESNYGFRETFLYFSEVRKLFVGVIIWFPKLLLLSCDLASKNLFAEFSLNYLPFFMFGTQQMVHHF